MSVIVYRFDEAPAALRALSDYGSNTDYVIAGDVDDSGPRANAEFLFVVESLDYDVVGAGPVHRSEHNGRPVDVYFIRSS